MPHCLYVSENNAEFNNLLHQMDDWSVSKLKAAIAVWQEHNEEFERYPTKEELEESNWEDMSPAEDAPVEEKQMTKEQILKARQDAFIKDQQIHDYSTWQQLAAADKNYKPDEINERRKQLRAITDNPYEQDEHGLYIHSPNEIDKAKEELVKLNEYERLLKKKFTKYQLEQADVISFFRKNMDKKWTEDELTKEFAKWIKDYSPEAAKSVIKYLAKQLQAIATKEQLELIQKRNPEWVPGPVKDLPFLAHWTHALQSIGASHLDLQALQRLYSLAVRQLKADISTAKKETDKAAVALNKEFYKNNFLKRKLHTTFNPWADNSKMFKFFTYTTTRKRRDGSEYTYDRRITANKEELDHDAELKAKYDALTPAQKDWVKVYDKYIAIFEPIHVEGNKIGDSIVYGSKAFIRIGKSFGDHRNSTGGSLFNNYLTYISSFGGPIDKINMFYTDKQGQTYTLPFAVIKKLIQIKSDKNKNLTEEEAERLGIPKELIPDSREKIAKANAIVKIRKMTTKAKELLANKSHEDKDSIWDDEEMQVSQFAASERGTLRSKFQHASAKYMKNYSQDHYRALTNYIQDMYYVKNMQQLMPLIEGIDTINDMDPAHRKNVKLFFENWKSKVLFREPSKTPRLDKWLRFFRILTRMGVMAFNISASFYNVVVGKYQTFRGLEADVRRAGEKRFGIFPPNMSNFKKTQRILKNYDVLSYEPNKELYKNVGFYFDKLMYGMIEAGENYIQGSSIIGHLSNEQYDKWFDKNGDLRKTDEKGKVLDDATLKERHLAIKKILTEAEQNTFRLQGAYPKEFRRLMFTNEIGKIVGQFRIWMPEAYVDRFGKFDIDAYGNKRQGTINHFWYKGRKEILKNIRDPKFFTSKEFKYVMQRRNLRSAMMATVILTGSLGFMGGGGGGGDDDDDYLAFLDAQLFKVLGDMLFVFDPHTLKFDAKNLVPAMATVANFADAILNMRSFYKVNSRYHKKGDWKFPAALEKNMPYRNVMKYGNNLIEAADK